MNFSSSLCKCKLIWLSRLCWRVDRNHLCLEKRCPWMYRVPLWKNKKKKIIVFHIGITEPSGRRRLEILDTPVWKSNMTRCFLMNWDSFDQDAEELALVMPKLNPSWREEALAGDPAATLWCRQLHRERKDGSRTCSSCSKTLPIQPPNMESWALRTVAQNENIK